MGMPFRNRFYVGAIAAIALLATMAMARAQQASAADAESMLGRSGRAGETLARYLENCLRMFRSFDVDGDGVITQADLALSVQITEAGARASALFTPLMFDLDGDGTITRAEVEQFFAGQLGLYKPDARLSETERKQLIAGVDQVMASDTNGDGKIDSRELLAYAEKRAIRPFANGWPGVMLAVDENKDGRTTREEYLKAAEAAFRKVDTDGNGVLSRQEVDAFRALMQKAPNRP